MSSTVGENFWGSKGRIRDGVWGDVPVDKAVRTLLDTPAMTRLKGVASLGFAHFAYPTARHTNFDHAVGVYHLTRSTLRRITDSGAYLEDRDVRGALAAALLQNVGRSPHPWAVEGINLPSMVAHDEETRRVIEETEVSEVLRDTWDLEPHNIFRLVARGPGEPDADFLGSGATAPLRDLTPTEHLVRDLLSGALDLATLDGLVRDTRGAKLPFGNVDVEGMINSLRVVGQDNRAVLALDESGVGHLQSFVFARYLVHYNLYGHHALRVPTAMFLRAVQDAVQAGGLSAGELVRQDDANALALVSRSAEPDGSSATLVKRLTERRPYKRALELDERHPSYVSLIRLRDDASWRRRVEEAWARYLTRYRKGVAGPFDILIDLPDKGRFGVELRVILRSPGLTYGERNPVTWHGLSGLSEEDMVRYHAPLHRVRIATATDDLATSVRRHADELFTIAEEVG